MTRFQIILAIIIFSLWVSELCPSFLLLFWFIGVAYLGTVGLIFIFAYKGVFNITQPGVNYASLYSAGSMSLLVLLMGSLFYFNWEHLGTLLVLSFALFFARTSTK